MVIVTTLETGQLKFNGLTLGDNVDTFMEEVNGWDDLPPIQSTNAPMAMGHGSRFGKKYARERVITWSGVFQPEDVATWDAKLKAIRAALSVNLTEDDSEIRIRTHGEELVCYGSVSARAIPGNRSYGSVMLANLSVQFICADPRRYSPTMVNFDIGLPDGLSGGLTYPLTYPLEYGVAASGGYGTFLNEGDAPLPGVFTVTGPIESPSIHNDTTSRFVSFNIDLADGETLVIDVKNGTVILNGTTDRLYTKTITSSPLGLMELQPGNNLLRASAASWSAGANISLSAPAGAYF